MDTEKVVEKTETEPTVRADENGVDEMKERIRRELCKILDRQQLELDCYGVASGLPSRTVEQMLKTPQYDVGIDKAVKNGEGISVTVGKILDGDSGGVKSSIDLEWKIDETANRLLRTGWAKEISKAYNAQKGGRYYKKPSILKRAYIRFCNLLVRPLGVRLLFR